MVETTGSGLSAGYTRLPLPSFVRPNRRAILASAVGLLLSSPSIARRAIPDDNLAYPVLITLKFQNGQAGFGSGFYFRTTDALYIVTAKHVLFPAPAHALPDAELELLSYSPDLLADHRIVINATLRTLSNGGNIKPHPSRDVVVVKLGNVVADQPPSPTSPAAPIITPQTPGTSNFRVVYLPGISLKESPQSLFVAANRDLIKTYDQVLVGDDVIVYGYPRSLVVMTGDKPSQLDPLRPLLRRGIIAGLNEQNKTIILDCPVYRGNSGGPAVEIERDDLNLKLRLIGVVVEFVPLAEGSVDFAVQFNSGYSIVEPMDAVLELVQ